MAGSAGSPLVVHVLGLAGSAGLLLLHIPALFDPRRDPRPAEITTMVVLGLLVIGFAVAGVRGRRGAAPGA